MKLFKTISLLATLLFVATNANAGIITTTVSLPNVNDYTNSDALMLWDSESGIEGEIDSFDLSLTWKDQGWGNHKGRLFFQINSDPLGYIGIASHNWTTQTLSVSNLSSPGNSTFKLFYIVGGGGGHSLHINNATLTITSVPAPGGLLCLLGIALIATRRRHAV